MTEITIRKFTLDDIAETAALQERCSTAPWSETSLLTYFMRDDTLMLVSEENARITGFAAILMAQPDSDVLDITVSEDVRRRGIGEKLLTALCEGSAERGVKTVYLEVRASNVPAISLYIKAGFKEIGVRKNYYSDPKEDGYVMELKVC